MRRILFLLLLFAGELLAQGYGHGNAVQTGSVTSAAIAADAIDSTKVIDSGLTKADLRVSIIDSTRITNLGITSGDIRTAAVGASQIAATAVTAGSYTATNITVDADGRITSAANGIVGVGQTAQDSTGWQDNGTWLGLVAPTTDSVGIGARPLFSYLDIYANTASGTNNAVALLSLRRSTVGTPVATNYGLSQNWYGESTTTEDQLMARDIVRWQTATHASRTSQKLLNLTSSGTSAEYYRFTTTGFNLFGQANPTYRLEVVGRASSTGGLYLNHDVTGSDSSLTIGPVADAIFGGATGGSQGAGTINAKAFYDDGVLLRSAFDPIIFEVDTATTLAADTSWIWLNYHGATVTVDSIIVYAGADNYAISFIERNRNGGNVALIDAVTAATNEIGRAHV